MSERCPESGQGLMYLPEIVQQSMHCSTCGTDFRPQTDESRRWWVPDHAPEQDAPMKTPHSAPDIDWLIAVAEAAKAVLPSALADSDYCCCGCGRSAHGTEHEPGCPVATLAALLTDSEPTQEETTN